MTTVERTLFDLAASIGPDALSTSRSQPRFVAAHQPRTTSRRSSSGSQREGAPVPVEFRGGTRSCRPRRPAQTESEAEHLILRLLTKQGLPTPTPQYEIRDSDGTLVARVDFAYPDLKIAIEYDSYAHHPGTEAH